MDNQNQEEKRSSLNPQRRRTRAAGLMAFREESREDRDEEDEMDNDNRFSMIAVQRASEMTCGENVRAQGSVLSELPNLGNSRVARSYDLFFLRSEKISCWSCRGSSADDETSKS